MTRPEASAVLNLSPSASAEEIERAYRRLVQRYPPEFQPEKFRQIDEAYRYLTSFPHRLAKLLSPETKGVRFDPQLFSLSLPPPSSSLEEALSEVKKLFKISYLLAPSEENAKNKN